MDNNLLGGEPVSAPSAGSGAGDAPVCEIGEYRVTFLRFPLCTYKANVRDNGEAPHIAIARSYVTRLCVAAPHLGADKRSSRRYVTTEGGRESVDGGIWGM